MKPVQIAKSIYVGSLAAILIIGAAFADDKTFEITTPNGATEEYVWWEELTTCAAYYGFLNKELRNFGGNSAKIEQTDDAIEAFLGNAKKRYQKDRNATVSDTEDAIIGLYNIDVESAGILYQLSSPQDWQEFEPELQKCDSLLAMYATKFPSEVIK